MKRFTILITAILSLYACSSDEDPAQNNDNDSKIESSTLFEAFTSTSSNILPSINGPFEETLNSPGSLIKIEETYYLFYNDYVGGWPPTDIRIGYASSTDLKNWTRNPTISLSGEDIDYLNGINEHPSVSSVLVDEEGTIFLYFDVFINGKGTGVGLATADNVDGPWDVHDQMVLKPTPGSWDEHGMAASDVVLTDDGYRLYYGGLMGSITNPEMAIGMAESVDGIHWEKHDEPVFSKGTDGAWDSHKVETPRVLKTGDGWVMAYRSDAGTATWGDGTGYGIAISTDGIAWERFQPEAAIHENDFGWATIWATAFYKEQDTYYLFAETDGPPVQGTRINIYSYQGDFFNE
ncbi:MAG: hypothetical protein Tsb0034_20020 [Ekhidna sp.]